MADKDLIVMTAIYTNEGDATADFNAVEEVNDNGGGFDGYDAAVISRNADGDVDIVHTHETPTRKGALEGAGLGLAAGLVAALFPQVALTGGLVAGTTAGGAALGAITGHVTRGLDRGDLKELGEMLDAGAYGLIVVGEADSEDELLRSMSRAQRTGTRRFAADVQRMSVDAQDAMKKANEAAMQRPAQ